MFQGPKLSCVFLEMRLSRWIKAEKNMNTESSCFDTWFSSTQFSSRKGGLVLPY